MTMQRRTFHRLAAGAATAGLVGGPSAVHAFPSRRLRIACIGVGGRGGANLRTVARDADVQVVALCDVNRRNLSAAHQQFPDARTFIDFRQLYEFEELFDAVVVSTAEHTHAFATAPALRLGKHVYCEKPLTHNIAECRRITELAAQAQVATQMGTQIHASKNYHQVVAAIRSGIIGPVGEVHVWVSRAWGWQSKEEAERNKDIVFVQDRPTEAMQPPEYLDWDLWLGPAPYRPFHEVYFPGPKWYRWWDFGNGTMSDLGSHWNDLPFWALELNAPTSVRAEGPAPHPEIAPASMRAEYRYPARGNHPPCTLTWYQGTHKPDRWVQQEIPQWGNGVLFVGERGMLLSDYRQHILLPESEFSGYKPADIPDLPAGHHEQWLQACREGTPTGSHFGYAGPLTEANHLGNVAFRHGSEIIWDAAEMRITNSESANRFVSRQPRDGWTLEG
ncbi:MAG: gfo/Idh/MocA family oxidoreductase [Planctomycetota bacterium]|nr:MAG: gfo/Idh/MocA family oxidoreductase [Planctomycetota bacterium]